MAKLNPTSVGANAAGGEASELAVKQVAKTYVENQSTNTAVKKIAQTTQSTNQQIAQVKQKKPVTANAV